MLSTRIGVVDIIIINFLYFIFFLNAASDSDLYVSKEIILYCELLEVLTTLACFFPKKRNALLRRYNEKNGFLPSVVIHFNVFPKNQSILEIFPTPKQ